MCQLAITPPFNLALRQENVPAVLYSEIIKALYERRLSRCLLHLPISARPKTGDTEKYDRKKSIQLSSRIYFHSNINLGTITNTSPTNASCASKTTYIPARWRQNYFPQKLMTGSPSGIPSRLLLLLPPSSCLVGSIRNVHV